MGPIFDAPIKEVSGACFAGERLVIVGDDRPEVAWAYWDGEPQEWNVIDVASLPGAPPDTGQFEAVEHLRDSIVVVLCEEPALLLAIDLTTSTVTGYWHLEVGIKDLRKHWKKDDNSLGEGMFFGPDRVFVVKEKNPPAIVEFGPSDADSLGEYRPGRWSPDQSGTLSALAWWPIKGYSDVSDVCVVDEHLWVLSDQDRCFGRLDAKPTKLPKHIDKPEGLTRTPEGSWLIAVDNEDGRDALHVVPADEDD